MIIPRKAFLIAPILLAFFLQGCTTNYATELRIILAASAPLVESLNLGPKRAAVIADFAELAGGAATLESDFKLCGASKPCKLNAIGKLEGTFETVAARGNLGSNAKLQRVEAVAKGVILAAKVFYGGGQGKAAGSVPEGAEANLKQKMADLKAAMQPDK